MLTLERLKEVISYNPMSGHFTWTVPMGTKPAHSRAGFLRPDGYLVIKIDGERYRAHRLAFLFMSGSFPPELIDHIDGNPSNNAWANLRAATPSENQQSKAIRSDNRSGFVGASRSKGGRWQAHIKVNGRSIGLGVFDSPDEAHQAYLSAKIQLHPFATNPRGMTA